MKTWVLIAVIAHVLLASPPAQPDFSWGKDKEARRLLAASRDAWEAGTSTRSYPMPRQKAISSYPAFGEERLREIVRREDFADVAYQLLDTALAKETSLDRARMLYRKAAGSAREALGRFEESYHLARSRTRLAAGVARAAVAQKMAAQGNSAYAFQAMESAIDALRDAADEAAKCPSERQRAERIRAFRAALFAAWDAAERTKNLRLLTELSIPREYDRAFPVVE